MTDIDYSQLNDQATKLYDSAHRAGYSAGADAKVSELATHTARSHLDLAVRMLSSALIVEDAEGARLLAMHARTLIARTPSMHEEISNVSTHLGAADLNDSNRPFRRGIVEASLQRCKGALEDLGGFR